MMRNTLLLKNAQAVAANPPKAGVFNWGFQMVFSWYSTGIQLVSNWYVTGMRLTLLNLWLGG